jgi:flagellar motor switch protein FliN
MTDEPGGKEAPNGAQSSEGRGIIDASARTRPRIHRSDESGPEEAEELSFLSDVPLKLNVLIGDAAMTLGELMALDSDSTVQLDKPSGEPVDIYIENQKLGKGEVIVLHEKLRIRVLEITSPSREQEEIEGQALEEEQQG